MADQREGFSYSVSEDQINRYKVWSIERRLEWLLYGNKLRKYLPSKTIEIQEAFRKGESIASSKAVIKEKALP